MTPICVIAMSVLFLVSCSSDSVSDDGTLRLKASVNLENRTLQKVSSVKGSSLKETTSIEVTTFMINIKEIALEVAAYDTMGNNFGDMKGNYSDMMDGYGGMNGDYSSVMRDYLDRYCTDIEFEGPFELDLLNGSMSIDIAAADLPNDSYEEIAFYMDICSNAYSELYGKSILIKGTINDMPFVFWHNTNEEFEIDYSNTNDNLIIQGGSMTTTINFDLSLIFGAGSAIDFSLATDADGDGIIEINPNNDDTNKVIADQLKDLLEETANLLDN